jgi:Rod binding domain-containing protein
VARVQPRETASARPTSFSASVSGGAAQAGPKHPTPEAFKKFEAMVLQTFLQSMLPKDAEAVYGGGMAGDMWKSFLAQQLGEVMAERGGIGIADRILGPHYAAAPQTGNSESVE